MEFKWKKFPGFTTLGLLDEIQKMMTELRCEPEQFQGRIIFMAMYNDIKWRTPGNEETYMANSLTVAAYANKFRKDVGPFWDLDPIRNGNGTHHHKPGEWNKPAEGMMVHFAESGHLVFRAISALEREELKSKGGGNNPSTSTEVEKPLNRFFALSISSVSTEQSRICAKNWIQIQEFKPKVKCCESLVIPTEIPNADATSQSTTSLAHGDVVARLRKEIRRTS